ncbi:hypothetical protein MTP99_011637 [Tenebrio molitor]|nr:hypothetical protein MTP99_011637 [Tenebrio molitor]
MRVVGAPFPTPRVVTRTKTCRMYSAGRRVTGRDDGGLGSPPASRRPTARSTDFLFENEPLTDALGHSRTARPSNRYKIKKQPPACTPQ